MIIVPTMHLSKHTSGAEIYVKITLNDAHVAKSGSGTGYGGPWSWTGADTVPELQQ